MLSAAILAVMVVFLFNPNKYVGFVFEGLRVWALNVLPCLFPFFFLSKLLIELDCLDAVKRIFKPLTRFFKVPDEASYVFLVSLLSGYPVGVKTACELTEKGVFTADQCGEICGFCNFAGPIFVMGTISAFFESQKIGLIILISVILGALLNGLLYVKKKKILIEKAFVALPNISVEKRKNLLNDCMFSAINSILFVGGTIAVFYMFGQMISLSVPNCPALLSTIIDGILEMTSGSRSAAFLSNRFLGVVLACAFLSFGGLCVFMQCCAFWEKAKVKISKMLLKKTTQTVVSVAVCILLCFLFKV